MSRIGSEQIQVAPRNNVYTVLAAVAAVMSLLALVVLITKAKELLGPGGIMS